jgi:hypothetical protein
MPVIRRIASVSFPMWQPLLPRTIIGIGLCAALELTRCSKRSQRDHCLLQSFVLSRSLGEAATAVFRA